MINPFLPVRAFAIALIAAVSHFSAQAAELNDDGLHSQPWFMETFLDLREDLADVSAKGKRLAIIFEQRGCPYCREMHNVNLADEDTVTMIKEKFGVLQLNIWGSRAVTDFDGEELEERDLAKKWRVVFTPTIVFIDDKMPEGASKASMEVMRMPGYFKPFHFASMFEYVAAGAYKDQQFQKFLQHRFEELEKQGKKPDLW